MNILEIIVIVAFLLFAAAGFRSGFVKKLASMVALVLSVILVAFFLPYITGFLQERTPVYDMITDQCRRVVAEQTADLLTGNQAGEETGGSPELDREQIKGLLEANGYDSAVVDSLSDEQLQSYVQQYAQDYLQQSSQESQSTAEPGRLEQMEIIENLPVPQVLKDLLQDHNNAEGYENLQVSTFQDYVINFISVIILNLVSFIAAVILVRILLRVAIAALDIISHIPVFNMVNRLAGLLLGLVQGLFWIWVFFLLLSMFSATETGLWLMSMVQESQLLSTLYETNLFMQIVLQAVMLFL
ncbi:MAG TPA: CvpA family protein [Candidatus Choladousia intestinigallinarum]|nr:CvpA family protein [Candidatus Choladousia intestinigallinarum]